MASWCLLSSQATNYDKDVRIVAMDDLCLELEKDSQLSIADEKQCVQECLRVLFRRCMILIAGLPISFWTALKMTLVMMYKVVR